MIIVKLEYRNHDSDVAAFEGPTGFRLVLPRPEWELLGRPGLGTEIFCVLSERELGVSYRKGTVEEL